ncbi:MAG: hypothetical protein IJW86_06430 [Clostridia bacterium]|nr:hypothetical protein [Clostridia bacterium]
MFGYVKTDKPEMKIKDYEAYKGLYCSLCSAMGKHFGVLSRLTLSYDITFLVLARLSFSGTVPCFEGGRCPFNPTKKCNYCNNSNEELRYAAAVSMMMFYFKVKDNISDGNIFKRLLMYLILPWATFKYKKAKKMYSEIAEIIEQSMALQKETEKKNTDIPDEAAHASAHALGRIMAYNMNDAEDNIYRFGYGIGKWVYLTDAIYDIEKDIKSGNYNVFVNKYDLCAGDSVSDIKAALTGTMNMCGAIFGEAYEKAENKSLTAIMENIIYDGMYKTLNSILNKEKSKGKD